MKRIVAADKPQKQVSERSSLWWICQDLGGIPR